VDVIHGQARNQPLACQFGVLIVPEGNRRRRNLRKKAIDPAAESVGSSALSGLIYVAIPNCLLAYLSHQLAQMPEAATLGVLLCQSPHDPMTKAGRL
jgi:hypothetical protein